MYTVYIYIYVYMHIYSIYILIYKITTVIVTNLKSVVRIKRKKLLAECFITSGAININSQINKLYLRTRRRLCGWSFLGEGEGRRWTSR